VKANWRDNPWFPAVLEEERRLDLQLYPERYPHVWEGEYAKAFEGAYFARQLEQARQERRICRVAVSWSPTATASGLPRLLTSNVFSEQSARQISGAPDMSAPRGKSH